VSVRPDVVEAGPRVAADPVIEVVGLTKRYGAQAALRGVDLRVPAGSILTVLGHNGSGKTTLVRILATLVRPTAGSARVAGHDVVRERLAVRRAIALVGHDSSSGRVTGRAARTEVTEAGLERLALAAADADP